MYTTAYIIFASFVAAAGNDRIVGGAEIRPHEFPSLVNGPVGCAGTLLYPGWVLSAAHCVVEYDPEKDVIIAGIHNQNDENYPALPKRNVSKYYIHEHHRDPTHYANDIALVKLERPFDLSDIIQLVTLPTKDYVDHEKCAWVVGWGRKKTLVPHKVDVPIRTPEKCWEYLQPEYENETQLCAGYDEGGKDACGGDSGGPLYVIEDGKQIQVGIVSWGAGCGEPLLPGAYTRVTSYLDWIAETIRKDGE